jgi:hypothetical protein
MKDSDLRGIVLQKFYDARHKIAWFDLNALSTHVQADFVQLANVCDQLGQHGLIEWRAIESLGGTVGGAGKITARGVDVIEGTATAPITITLHDQSIKVTGSINTQIGNSNQQKIEIQISSLMNAIDSMDASKEERTKAKGLLEQILTNPLVAAAIGALLGK